MAQAAFLSRARPFLLSEPGGHVCESVDGLVVDVPAVLCDRQAPHAGEARIRQVFAAAAGAAMH